MNLSWLFLAFCFHFCAGDSLSNTTPVSSKAVDGTTTRITLTKTLTTSVVLTRSTSAIISNPVAANKSTSNANPTITNTWVGTDSTDVASLFSCYAENDEYRSKVSSWFSANPRVYQRTYVGTTSVYVGNTSRPVSTLCDGWPRAPGSGLSYISSTVTQTITSAPSYPGPTPTCRYNYHGCELQLSSYLDEFSRVQNISTATRPRVPDCVLDTSQCLMPAGASGLGCRFDAGHVRMLYWAEEPKDPSALCVNSTRQTTPQVSTPDGPVTAVYDGHTLTSPTVYLSFDTVTGNLCFGTHTNAIIGVPPESVSSVHFSSLGSLTTTRPVNWADMNYPVPASAYTGMMDCWTYAWDGKRKDSCATIYDDDYLPRVALPTDAALFTGLDSRFGNCSRVSWRKYVLDPPQAMKPADHL